ncbi:MAG: MFS transporter [Myxococcota bacterium]
MSDPASPAPAPPAAPTPTAWWRPWTWVPSLYFVEGLPYVVANNVSIVMYKQLELSNAAIAFYTSWFGLVWAFKALWSPFVDRTSSKRRWTVVMQAAMAPVLVLLALSLPLPSFLQLSLAGFLVLAVLSATHDIAADGFYMLGLPEDQQSAFVGVRSTFWRIALVLGEGGLVMLAGWLAHTRTVEAAWTTTLLVAATLFAVFAAFHALVMPTPAADPLRAPPVAEAGQVLRDAATPQAARVAVSGLPALLAWAVLTYTDLPLALQGALAVLVAVGVLAGTLGPRALATGGSRPAWLAADAAVAVGLAVLFHALLPDTSLLLVVVFLCGPFWLLHGLMLQQGGSDSVIGSFAAKPGIGAAVLFLLFYRFAENHLARLVSPFLLDPVAVGGLGLSAEAVGFAKGTVGVLALTAGGILGGLAIWRHGLKAWLWPMVFALNAPDLVYVWLAYAQPDNYPLVVGLIGVEQFGYGFGFTAYMMFMIRLAEGEHKTAHYAFATGLMALFAWAAQSWSGWMEEQLGYQLFFVYVLAWILPGIFVAWWVDIPPSFGKRKE